MMKDTGINSTGERYLERERLTERQKYAESNHSTILTYLRDTGGAKTPFCVTDTATSELFSTENAAPSTETGDHTTMTNAQFSLARASLTCVEEVRKGGRQRKGGEGEGGKA